MATRTALVTGVTGLIGSHIAERLVHDGWRVRGLIRDPAAASGLAAMGIEPVTGDVLDAPSLARAAAGSDVLFHNAAAITPRGGWEVFRRLNVDGTANAVAAAEQSGARLLQLSSVAVYGDSGRYRDGLEKTHEDLPLGPLPDSAFYARSKRESEALVMGAHAAGRIWAAAVRPCVVYGPRDRQFVPRVAALLRRGFAPLVGGGESILPVVHAANVADGVVRAATSDHAAGRAYNLANDFPITVRDFFRLGARGLGRDVRFVSVPTPLARALFAVGRRAATLFTGGRLSAVSAASIGFLTRDNPFTSERAYRELGWSPAVRPDQGVRDAFRWHAAHG